MNGQCNNKITNTIKYYFKRVIKKNYVTLNNVTKLETLLYIQSEVSVALKSKYSVFKVGLQYI